MPLVNMVNMLNKAKEGKYAVGQFNINNLEWTKTILETAQSNNSPVILGVSEGAGKYMGGFDVVVGMVKGLVKDLGITVDVAIHLDHGSSFESCKKAIDAGMSSADALAYIKMAKDCPASILHDRTKLEAFLSNNGIPTDNVDELYKNIKKFS